MWFTTLRYGAQFSHIDKWFQEIFRIVLFSKTLSWWSYLFEAIVMIKNCSIQKLKQFQNPLEMEIIIYYGISSTRDKLLLFNFPKSQYLLSYSFHESFMFFCWFFQHMLKWSCNILYLRSLLYNFSWTVLLFHSKSLCGFCFHEYWLQWNI